MAAQPIHMFLNGSFLPAQEAVLHVSDLAIQRGYGVFDFFKVDHQQPLFLDAYLDRFYTSASLMYLAVPYSKDELKQLIEKLISLNQLKEVSGVKMILTGGYSDNGFEPGKPNFIMQQQPLQLPTKQKIEQGITITTHEYLRDLPVVKSINYTTGIRLLHYMKAQGAEEVLYHHQGVVTEFPRCNFFIVTQDNTVVTPAHNILKGITRQNVLMLADKKYKVQERAIPLEEVLLAKEAFLTSTTKRILPIVKINKTEVGNGNPGPITLALLEDLLKLENTVLSKADQ